jgi:hypothetical protein
VEGGKPRLSQGSIKGDVKRKHFSLRWRARCSLTSSPRVRWQDCVLERGSGYVHRFRDHLRGVVPCGFFAPASSVVADCQPRPNRSNLTEGGASVLVDSDCLMVLQQKLLWTDQVIKGSFRHRNPPVCAEVYVHQTPNTYQSVKTHHLMPNNALGKSGDRRD